MSAKFSPAPWFARPRDWGYPEYEGGPERRLWEVYDAQGVQISGCTIYSLDEHDAKLMAAAPDLYEALDGLIGGMWIEDAAEENRYVRARLTKARAALAKARGES